MLPDKTALQDIAKDISSRSLINDRNATLDRKAWGALAASGLWRIPVSREHGGFGGTWQQCISSIDTVAQGCADLGFLVTMLGHIGSIKLLIDYGTERQKTLWLPRLLNGEIAAGLIDGITSLAISRIHSREAFGKKLSEFQYIRGR